MMLNIMAKIIMARLIHRKNIRKIKPTFVNFWQDLSSTKFSSKSLTILVLNLQVINYLN